MAAGCPSTGRKVAIHGQIVKCPHCGFVCTYPQEDAKSFEIAYQNLSDPDYLSERAGRIITAARHLRFVNRFIKPSGKLLDVGCSAGYFLAEAARDGWSVVGIEPSQWAVEVAKGKQGLVDIQCGLFEEINVLPDSFNCITMWDVLEHVADPYRTLAKAAASLKPGGLLFLNLPNIESVTARIMKGHWVLLLREHLWYFSPQTIGLSLHKAGFDLLQIAPNSVTFSLQGILNRVSQYKQTLRWMTAKIASQNSALARKLITFRMGEMIVVAKKSNGS